MKNNELKEYIKNLESLKNKEDITIIGHDNYDVDTVLSGILLSKLFKHLGIKSHFAIIEPVKENETYDILKKLANIKINKYEELSESSKRNLFLVDHYETHHKGNVVGCIDHHPTAKENTYEFSFVKNSSATTFMIYELMQVSNYIFNTEEIQLIIIAMMIDTTAFRSSKAIPEEIKVAKELAKEYHLDYKFLKKHCLCLTPIENMDIDEITSNGHKTYSYNGHKVKSSYLQLDGIPNKTTLNKWITYLNDKLSKNRSSIELLIFLIFDIKSNTTIEYQIMKDCVKKVIYDGILSRGNDIMPKIEKKYANNINQEKQIEKIIKKLSKNNYTISTMESCTGGGLANAITNVSGASEILNEAYVTYCNESKIKLGVPEEVIQTHSVYSLQTAEAMASAVKLAAKSDVGVGITGQLGRVDPKNLGVKNDKAWYCIKTPNEVFSTEIIFYSINSTREMKKDIIIREIITDLSLI